MKKHGIAKLMRFFSSSRYRIVLRGSQNYITKNSAVISSVVLLNVSLKLKAPAPIFKNDFEGLHLYVENQMKNRQN